MMVLHGHFQLSIILAILPFYVNLCCRARYLVSYPACSFYSVRYSALGWIASYH